MFFTGSMRCKFSHLWNLCDSYKETLPREFILRDSGLFLINTDCLSQADKDKLSQESRGFTSLALNLTYQLLDKVFKNSQKFSVKVTIQAFMFCTALNNIFYVLIKYSTKLWELTQWFFPTQNSKVLSQLSPKYIIMSVTRNTRPLVPISVLVLVFIAVTKYHSQWQHMKENVCLANLFGSGIN